MPNFSTPEVNCPVCGIPHCSWTTHWKYRDLRRRIQEAGAPFINSLPEELHNIAGAFMELNEDWTILHPQTVGEDFILEMGFTDNQKHFLERLVPLIIRSRHPRKAEPGDELEKSIWLPAAYADVEVTYRDEIDPVDFAWAFLAHHGYNYALSDVQDACLFLGHPMKENEPDSKWAVPWPVRCYCGEIAYRDGKRYRCYDARDRSYKEGDEVPPWKPPVERNRVQAFEKVK